MKKHAESIDELRAYADELYDANPTREQLGELADFAYDPAIKGFRAHEVRQAKRLERQLGVKLERSKDAGYDFYDPVTGNKYDLKGAPAAPGGLDIPKSYGNFAQRLPKKPDVTFAIDARNWRKIERDEFARWQEKLNSDESSRVLLLK
ncbi:MAG: hypothetical protein RIC36_19615 [Rhodospirillales bacterium]